MGADVFRVDYRLTPAVAPEREYHFVLDAVTLERMDPRPEPVPSWARLEFHQCAVCPLDAGCHEYCPLAVRLAEVVERFGELISYEPLRLEVVTAERTVLQDTTAQRALGSLLGLLMATSGCPLTRFLRPMARFHLPLADEIETVYRAVSMYLLAQYLRHARGATADFDLDGLRARYATVRQVNMGVAERLRAALENDAAVGGVVILDMYAVAIPQVLDDALEEIEPIFSPYLAPGDGAGGG